MNFDEKDLKELKELFDERLSLKLNSFLNEIKEMIEKQERSKRRYTINEISVLESVSRQTVNNWIGSRKLRPTPIGGRIFIKGNDYDDFKNGRSP